jgi:hypothetical protein
MNQLDKLKEIITLVDESVSQKDFNNSFGAVLNFVRQLKIKLDEAIRILTDKYDRTTEELTADYLIKITELNDKINRRLAELKDGEKGEIGDRGEIGPQGIQGINGADGSPDTAENIRNKLEILQGDDRLDANAIKGLEVLIEKLAPRKLLGGGVGNRWLDGLLNVNTDGKVDGSTLIWDNTNQYWKVGTATSPVVPPTIILTASGARNDTNTLFTFSSVPNMIYVNGMVYRDGHGCTISGTTVTLDNPVGTDGDIFGTSVIIIIPDSGAIDDSNTAFVFTSEPTVVIINGTAYRNGKGVTISGVNVTTDNPVGTNGDIYGFSESIATTVSTINDTNLEFAFSVKPTLISVNGAVYREEHGWSWSTELLIATLNNAVGSSGDIYSIIL